MHALRNARSLTRLVLAWFVLTLGLAVASPVVHPQSMQVLCTGTGSMQVVMVDDDGQVVPGHHHVLDCPLCLVVTTPPVHPLAQVALPQPLAVALQPVVAARIAARVGAPLPPRGPPARA